MVRYGQIQSGHGSMDVQHFATIYNESLEIPLPQSLSTQLQFKNSSSPWAEPPKAVSVLMFPKLVKETSVPWDPRKPVGHAEAMDRRFAGMAPKKPVGCDSLETAKNYSGKVWKSMEK